MQQRVMTAIPSRLQECIKHTTCLIQIVMLNKSSHGHRM